MKDHAGTDRGQCEFEDCICVEFVKPKASKDGTFKCDYCEHAPSQHKNAMLVKPSPKQLETPSKSSSTQSNANESWDSPTNNNNTASSPPSQSTTKSNNNTPPPRKEIAVASSSKEPKKKSSFLDDLKNPLQVIKNATKQKKQ